MRRRDREVTDINEIKQILDNPQAKAEASWKEKR